MFPGEKFNNKQSAMHLQHPVSHSLPSTIQNPRHQANSPGPSKQSPNFGKVSKIPNIRSSLKRKPVSDRNLLTPDLPPTQPVLAPNNKTPPQGGETTLHIVESKEDLNLNSEGWTEVKIIKI